MSNKLVAVINPTIVLVSLISLFLIDYIHKTPNQNTPPVIKGIPAPQRVNFDLAGKWSISRYSEPGHPGKLGPWEALLYLSKSNEVGVWPVKESKWKEARLSSPLDDVPNQYLKLVPDSGPTRWFLITESHFGLLKLTGDDDELYLAVRTDGPSGEGI